MSKPSIREIFKQNLNQLFINKNVTQKALADFIGVSTATVSDWRKGKVFPRMDRIDRICQFFHIDRSELLSTFDIDKQELLDELKAQKPKSLHKIEHKGVLNNTWYVKFKSENQENDTCRDFERVDFAAVMQELKNTQQALAAVANEPERPTITKEEHALLDAYRNAPADKKTIVNLTLGLTRTD